MGYILAAIIIIALLYFFWRKKGAGESSSVKRPGLKKRLPASLTDEQIERHIARLKERYPGRSEEWYIEKMISDFERDRS